MQQLPYTTQEKAEVSRRHQSIHSLSEQTLIYYSVVVLFSLVPFAVLTIARLFEVEVLPPTQSKDSLVVVMAESERIFRKGELFDVLL